jgi:hypothetical protein
MAELSMALSHKVGLGTGPSPKPLAGLTEAQRESLKGQGLVKLLLKDAQV